MKQNQFFEVMRFDKTETEIVVEVSKWDIVIPVTIPLDKYHTWLLISDRLQWEVNSTDHTGAHIQLEGVMSYDEYWDCGECEHTKDDLYKYIVTHPITYQGAVFTKSVESLELAFDLHNAQRPSPYPFEVVGQRWEHEQEVS